MNNKPKIIVLNQFDISGNRINVSLSEIEENDTIKELVIKNFEIDYSFFSKIKNIKKINKLVFINCILEEKYEIKNVDSLKFFNCKNIRNCILGEKIRRLYIENCDYFDLKDIINLNLNALKIDNTLTKNLNLISNFEDIEFLYLNNIYIKEKIKYKMLKKLKRVNLDGSYVDNKEEYLKQFENCNFEFTFLEENLPI